MFVIGTAGHIDHGKSALVRALTGVDPDRLQEEKDRGMTIDLGFGWLSLPGGDVAGIVDVPGHERFIKNMLAGVGGIDLALLVVAADEGVMPQTREHLAILDLLGIERGILVVAKSDLVEPDFLELVSEEVKEAVEGTTLEGSPLVACSAITGQGLTELRSAIETALGDLPAKRDLGRPRLPIDRVFTVAGFGTVVTGTLIDGSFDLGQDVAVLPAIASGHVTTLASRVRGLQTHGSGVEQALPGTRTAVNLGGLAPEQLSRGQVVTTAGWLRPSVAVDVRLSTLSSLPRSLRHNLTVTFHCYSAEVPARLRLLESDEAHPGSEVWAQLRLLKPAALVNGDRFVIRDANDTLGGGVVVETQPRRHPRRRPGVIADLESRLVASPAETMLAAIAAAEPIDPAAAARHTELSPDAAGVGLQDLIETGRLILLPVGDSRLAYRRETFDALQGRALEAVAAYQKENPTRQGMPREELRNRLKLDQRLFGAIVAAFVSAKVLAEAGPAVSTPGWSANLNPAQRAAADAYLTALSSAPFSPPTDVHPNDEVRAFLAGSGAIVDVGDSVVLSSAAYEEMVTGVLQLIDETGSVSLAGVRDRFGTSRRYAQALLEHLDGLHITVRRGDERVRGNRQR